MIQNTAYSKEVCSRIATINYQEVLVDLSNTQKGEGLKFYLNQDLMAKKYLKIYQKNSSQKLYNAILGSVGSIVTLLAMTSSDKRNRRNLLFSGAAIFAVNFLTAKTFQYANEKNLIRSIDEYNKRNVPKIYFGTGAKGEGNSVFIEKNWSY